MREKGPGCVSLAGAGGRCEKGRIEEAGGRGVSGFVCVGSKKGIRRKREEGGWPEAGGGWRNLAATRRVSAGPDLSGGPKWEVEDWRLVVAR